VQIYKLFKYGKSSNLKKIQKLKMYKIENKFRIKKIQTKPCRKQKKNRRKNKTGENQRAEESSRKLKKNRGVTTRVPNGPAKPTTPCAAPQIEAAMGGV
jgi:hypothetical protein